MLKWIMMMALAGLVGAGCTEVAEPHPEAIGDPGERAAQDFEGMSLGQTEQAIESVCPAGSATSCVGLLEGTCCRSCSGLGKTAPAFCRLQGTTCGCVSGYTPPGGGSGSGGGGSGGGGSGGGPLP